MEAISSYCSIENDDRLTLIQRAINSDHKIKNTDKESSYQKKSYPLQRQIFWSVGHRVSHDRYRFSLPFHLQIQTLGSKRITSRKICHSRVLIVFGALFEISFPEVLHSTDHVTPRCDQSLLSHGSGVSSCDLGFAGEVKYPPPPERPLKMPEMDLVLLVLSVWSCLPYGWIVPARTSLPLKIFYWVYSSQNRYTLCCRITITQRDYRTELYYFQIIFGNSCSVITEPNCFWNHLISVRSVSRGLPNPLPNCLGNCIW